MRKLIYLLLTLSLTLGLLTISYAQDVGIEAPGAADVNADGLINILDLTFIAAHFGETVALDQDPNPDANGDGLVNIFDLTFVAGHLGKSVSPPVVFVSVDPGIFSQLEVDDTITLTFDNTPDDLTVNTGTATVTGNTATITGPFEPGALTLTVTWLDGTQTFNYTVRQPAEFVSADPAANSELSVDDTITLIFDHTPEDVVVSTGVTTIAGKTVEITGPFTPGALALTIVWADGTQTLTYVVLTPDTESPKITGGTINDGDKDIDSEAINSSGRIEVEFSEEVTGNMALYTAGNDVGWIGTVEGNIGLLELVVGKDLSVDTGYVIRARVSDAAGNGADLQISFTTQSRTTGIPFPVTDATFDSLVLKSTIPVVVEFWKDG